jgi:hypothetical protein
LAGETEVLRENSVDESSSFLSGKHNAGNMNSDILYQVMSFVVMGRISC